MPDHMKSITYVSAATRLLTGQELTELLAQSRDGNAIHGITGMLLYNAGSFMQTIEGPEAEIDQLYANIRKDARNKLVITLLDEPIDAREFPSWSMGFKDVSNQGLTLIPGFTPFLDHIEDYRGFAGSGSAAKKLLLNFRNKTKN